MMSAGANCHSWFQVGNPRWSHALIWRWTGYNMVFYLAGLQNIDYSIYEAARIDGASPSNSFIPPDHSC